MHGLVIACLHRSIVQVQRLRDDFKKEESADGDAENSTAAPLKKRTPRGVYMAVPLALRAVSSER